jgi:lipopolysaccharide export system protein LptA
MMLAIAKYVSTDIFDTGLGNADLKTTEYIQSTIFNNQLSIQGGPVLKFQQVLLTLNRFRWLWTVAFLAVAVLLTDAAWTAGEPKAGQAENEPIRIVADELISYNEDKYAEFIGNVKVTQGNFTITSDKLRIYYQGELLDNEKKGGDEELLKKIIATGNVIITSEQYNAEAEKAEYDTATMTVILSGKNAKVISGKNSITGSKITLNRKSGQVKVEGSKNKRIKAEFYTKDKASDAFKIEKSEE